MEVHGISVFDTRQTICDRMTFEEGLTVTVEEAKITCDVCKERFKQGLGALYSKHPNDVKAASHHPSHYNTGDIEVIDAIDDWQLGFYEGNVVKYVARAGHKESDKALQDLVKARWYLNRLIVHSGGEDWNPDGTFREDKKDATQVDAVQRFREQVIRQSGLAPIKVHSFDEADRNLLDLTKATLDPSNALKVDIVPEGYLPKDLILEQDVWEYKGPQDREITIDWLTHHGIPAIGGSTLVEIRWGGHTIDIDPGEKILLLENRIMVIGPLGGVTFYDKEIKL